jgi:hypothetical protein
VAWSPGLAAIKGDHRFTSRCLTALLLCPAPQEKAEGEEQSSEQGGSTEPYTGEGECATSRCRSSDYASLACARDAAASTTSVSVAQVCRNRGRVNRDRATFVADDDLDAPSHILIPRS